jgi:hypothetical protein
MEDSADTNDVPKDDSASVRVSQLSSATDNTADFVIIFPSLVERSGRWGLSLLYFSLTRTEVKKRKKY